MSAGSHLRAHALHDTIAPRALIERLLDLVDRGEWNALPDLYATDAVVELPFAQPAPIRLEGRAAIREHLGAASRAPLRLRVINRTIHETTDPEVIIAEYRYDGLATRAGRQFVVSNVQIFRIRGGEIITSRDFHDHAAFAAAVGRSPSGEPTH